MENPKLFYLIACLK